MKLNNTFVLFFLLMFVSCQKKDSEQERKDAFVFNLPSWVSLPKVPKSNPMSLSKIELGKRLFHDKRLSVDSSISCSSCHLSNLAFTDGLEKSIGVFDRITNRNSPSLLNVAFAPTLFADGGVKTLESQVLAPIEEFTEMDFHIIKVKNRLKYDGTYNNLTKKAFGIDTITEYVIAKSIAAFERTLFSFNSSFDDYYYNGNQQAINEQAKKGWLLFSSDSLSCVSCHTPPLFTDYRFYDIGLDDEDDGRYRITGLFQDKGKFKTPSLRNIALTSPYFHDGSEDSLEGVLDFFTYSSHNKENKNRKLKISESDKKDLLAFLYTLTELNESF